MSERVDEIKRRITGVDLVEIWVSEGDRLLLGIQPYADADGEAVAHYLERLFDARIERVTYDFVLAEVAR